MSTLVKPGAKHFGLGELNASMSNRNAAKSTMATTAYCVKCKEKREMKNPKEVTMKNGKKAMSGTCPVCSTKLFRIGG